MARQVGVPANQMPPTPQKPEYKDGTLDNGGIVKKPMTPEEFI